MSKSITTYEELLQEEQRLTQQIKSQGLLLKADLEALKESLHPVGKAVNFINKMATRDHTGPLANFGIDFGIDLLVRKVILARAGWFTKIFVPFIVKNYSSHIVNDEHRAKFAQKIQNIFNKIRPKRQGQKDAKAS